MITSLPGQAEPERDFAPEIQALIVGRQNGQRFIAVVEALEDLPRLRGRILGLAEFCRLTGADDIEVDRVATSLLMFESLRDVADRLGVIESAFAGGEHGQS